MNSQKSSKHDNTNTSVQFDESKEGKSSSQHLSQRQIGKKSSGSKSKQQASGKKHPAIDKTELNKPSSIESIVHDHNVKGFSKNSVEIDGQRIEFFRNYQEYIISKQQEAERKQKWKKWQKTEFRSLSPTTPKIDFFSDSSDDEAVAGANLSKNLSLKTLEKNVENLRKERETAKNKAIEKKNAGNELILKKEYFAAVKLYTEGLQYAKDFKELYTNRALAYLKQREFRKAIQDCTRILEYIECFEGGFGPSSSICVKVNY